ncbi:MAG TPA: cyclic nucleotide-binding domain-containing protein [Candidatus Latescibacteria bacterium]|nr:cyclic nucleotide-binding domain-containing protein [Candidatus Handelsmanbacteria bacterium]HIL08414.1 cyclic nucleotide-binding domain-containing protein [Candidatus Latescibacterota bacterium]
MNQQQHRLMQVLQKISIFKGLELEHIQRFLRVGTSQTYEIGERVYNIGEPSDEMLVLLQGKMVVTSAGGEELGDIGSGMLTGEMGVFTNQPRSANISAVDRSIAVVIGRNELFSVLASNQTIHVCILENVVDILSERLSAANFQNDNLQKRIMELKGEEEDDYEAMGRVDDGMASEFDEYPGDEDDEDDEKTTRAV